jgi:hypothetical protein
MPVDGLFQMTLSPFGEIDIIDVRFHYDNKVSHTPGTIAWRVVF